MTEVNLISFSYIAPPPRQDYVRGNPNPFQLIQPDEALVNKQQELEVRTIAVEEKTKEKLKTLLWNQLKRRTDIENVKEVAERALIGLEEQIKLKKNHLLSSFLSILLQKRVSGGVFSVAIRRF
jgi:hypothetical protein